MWRSSKPIGTILVLLSIFLFSRPAYAKYSGGSGTADDPYQVATAADLIALGETPADYDKDFILTGDIDLDPNLPGRKVFTKAVIGSFSGVFDGNGYKISRLTIKGGNYLGLFSSLSGEVKNLCLVDVNTTGSGDYVAGLAGRNIGNVIACYSTGVVKGTGCVGGLVGWNYNGARITTSYSSGAVIGTGQSVGGLVGYNYFADVADCYSTGSVSGTGWYVGGLVGWNYYGSVTSCYSTGTVSGNSHVGGLVGQNHKGASITTSYSTGTVSGTGYEVGGLAGGNHGGLICWCYSIASVSGGNFVGGLVGSNEGSSNTSYYPANIYHCYSAGPLMGGTNTGGLVGQGQAEDVVACFWDLQTSGQATSAGGTGKTTTEMQSIQTYLDAGWDWVGEIENGTSEVWQMPQGGRYPALGTPRQLQGLGTPEDPYVISDALDLGAVVHYSPSAHYRLADSIDLAGIRWGAAVIPWFAGTLDGNGHTISHLTINGKDYLGLFGQLESGAEVKDIGVLDVNITGSGYYVGGLVGKNGGDVSACYTTGAVSGSNYVGGLVGSMYGGVATQCYSTGAVSGNWFVGGLVGQTWGSITTSFSTGTVRGSELVGGLVGSNRGAVTNCYSTGTVSGSDAVGGLVGSNGLGGSITRSYSTGAVSGTRSVGGLVGSNNMGLLPDSFWDVQASGQAASAGGTGKTTAEMKMGATFLDAGWDFVNIWGIGENQTYPYLRNYSAADINQDASVNFLDLAALAENWLTILAP